MTHSAQRLTLIPLTLATLAIGAFLSVYFYRLHFGPYMTITEIASTSARPFAGGKDIRIGGVIVYGTIEKQTGQSTTQMILTDYKNDIPLDYKGPLPKKIKEGEGVLAIGVLNTDNVFHAHRLLPKPADMFAPADIMKPPATTTP